MSIQCIIKLEFNSNTCINQSMFSNPPGIVPIVIANSKSSYLPKFEKNGEKSITMTLFLSVSDFSSEFCWQKYTAEGHFWWTRLPFFQNLFSKSSKNDLLVSSKSFRNDLVLCSKSSKNDLFLYSKSSKNDLLCTETTKYRGAAVNCAPLCTTLCELQSPTDFRTPRKCQLRYWVADL